MIGNHFRPFTKIEELEKKIAEATAKTEAAEAVEKNETAETADSSSAE